MNSATISVPHPGSPAPALDRVTLWLLLGFVAALQISIAAAQLLLALALLCWIVPLVAARRVPQVPPFFPALAVYAGLTLLSSAFSLDPRASFIDSKQLLLFLAVPLVYDVARGARASRAAEIVLAVGAASAAYGIAQYGLLHFDNLGRRPEGAMSHYMTYSGLLMLVLCTALARIVFSARDRAWPALILPALVVALAVTLGRSAWIGACAAAALLLVLRDFRLAALLPIVVAVVFAVAPDTVTSRVMSMFDKKDPTRQDRVAMLEIGTAIVKDHPFAGVGPNMIPRVYAQYRPANAVNAINPHLHNVPMQIAAERGLPALAAWLWFVLSLVIALSRLFHRGTALALTAAALAAVIAMLGAGLFEYNFGDSEFLMLLLVIVTLPFAAARDIDAAATTAA